MKIAILGTGLIGAAAAEGLMGGGHQVIVYNRTVSKTAPLAALGAKVAVSAEEAMESADATLIALPGGTELRAVLLEPSVRSKLSGQKILNASTTKPNEIIEIAREVENGGGSLAEVTVNAGPEQLRSKQGQFILGCKESEEQFWKDLLSGMGDLVLRAGDVGAASNAEVPLLLTSVLNLTTAAYVAAAAIKLNIPRTIVDQFIAPTVMGGEYILPKMLERDYNEVMASVDNFAIVANNALASAQAVGIPNKILEETVRLLAAASERGFKDQDGTSICEVLLDPALADV